LWSWMELRWEEGKSTQVTVLVAVESRDWIDENGRIKIQGRFCKDQNDK